MKRNSKMSRLLAAILTASLVFQQAGIASLAEESGSDPVVYTTDDAGTGDAVQVTTSGSGTGADESGSDASGSSTGADESGSDASGSSTGADENGSDASGSSTGTDDANADGSDDAGANEDANASGNEEDEQNNPDADSQDEVPASDENGSDGDADASGNEDAGENDSDSNDADAADDEASGDDDANAGDSNGAEEEADPEEEDLTGEEENPEEDEEEAASMPAVILTDDSLEDITITVDAPEGAFPEGVTMTVTAATEEEVTAFTSAVQAQLEEECGSTATVTIYDALLTDITFTVDGEEVQPQDDVKVTFSALNMETEGADYAIIYHVNEEDGTVEEMIDVDNTTVGAESYTFTANSFSEYGIVNASVDYSLGMSLTSATGYYLSYPYSSGENGGSSSTQTIYLHFMTMDGTEITTTATISGSYTVSSTNATLTLADIADAYTVSVDGTTYNYTDSAKIATSLDTTYANAISAAYVKYGSTNSGQGGGPGGSSGTTTYSWQYSTSDSNNNNYTTLSSAVTDIYLVYSDSDLYDTDKNKGIADHIDIEVNTTATLYIDGVEYTADIVLEQSDFTNNVTVTATWGGVVFTDFDYDPSDITTSSDKDNVDQFRVGGSYPVGTQETPVVYTFTLTKDVTFESKSGDSFTVTMSFTATFSYWLTTNNCPQLYETGQGGTSTAKTAWTSGGFISESGLDFVLEANDEQVTILVNKYIVDEQGNELAVDSAVTYGITVYEDMDQDDTSDKTSPTTGDTQTATSTFEVVANSSSDSYSTFVDVGYYYVIEDTSSLADTTISVDGTTYKYSRTYTVSSGTLESTGESGTKETTTGTTGVLKADATTTPVFNIYNVYSAGGTSVTVTKEWDDGNDVWKLRPESVEVTLYQGENVYTANGVTNPVTLSDENSWTYTWTELPTEDGDGNDYVYTVQETAVSGYTSYTSTQDTTEDGGIITEITNTLDTGSLTLAKTVNADSSIDTSSMTFTFVVSGFEAAAAATVSGIVTYSDATTDDVTYTVSDGTITVTVPAGGSVALSGIPTGTYTVTEYGESGGTVTANGYTWTVTDSGEDVEVTKSGATATITNTVADEDTIVVTKYWVDSNNANGTRPAMDEFTVTLTGSDGSTYTISNDSDSSAAWSSSSSSTSDYWNTTITVPAYDSSGNKITYTIKESEESPTSKALDAYTLDYITVGSAANSSKTYSDDSTLDPDGALSNATITPADGETYATLSNSLDTASIKVTKTLLDSDGNEIISSSVNDDDFTMRLYTKNGSDYTAVAARTLTLTGVMEHTFSSLPLGTYYLKEELASDNLHAYTVTVTVGSTTVTANDDGYYEIELTNDGATVSVTVTNQEQEINIQDQTGLFPAVTKNYTSDPANSGYEIEFTFYIMDSSAAVVATGKVTASIGDTNKAVTWTYATDAFTYTEVGTYVYTIREYNSTAAGIVYDDTVYTLVVTVDKDSDGYLQSSYKIYTAYYGEGNSSNVVVSGSSAVFTNIYDPNEINFFMIVRKVLTGRTITEKEFSVTLQEYESDFTTTVGNAITVYNGADSTFSYTFTYDAEGTYYYKAYENQGTETGMTYDSRTSWLKIVVENVNGALQVTSVEYVQFDTDQTPDANTIWTEYSGGLSDYVAFQNTYEASGSTTLTAYKDLDGRDLNAGEFTFLLVALDTNAPMPDGYVTAADASDVYYSDGYVALNQKYVTATNAADGSINFGTITYTQDDIGKTYEYRVKEIVGDLPGVTYDTSETGKLIYVTIADAGDGELTITVYTSGSEDKNNDDENDVVIYNTFSQGAVSVVGSKTWVDGGLSHTNSTEVKLMLYRTTASTPSDDVTDGTWEQVTTDRSGTSIVNSDGYITTVVWTTSTWVILNLPKYDKSGNSYIYTVVETADVDGYTYTTTYGTYGSGSSTYVNTAITNTIAQEYVILGGTKTWVDGAVEHSAGDITLIVMQNDTKLTEKTDYTVTWEKDDSESSANGEVWIYTITGTGDGLPMYDEYGVEYTYTVTEKLDEGSDSEVTVGEYTYTVTYGDDGNIINTREEEESTSDKTESGIGEEGTTSDGKTYVTYADIAVDGTITYTISYYNGSSEEATVTITDVLDNGVTFASATNPESWTGSEASYSITGQSTGTYSNGDSYSYGGTVIWEFPAAAFESGTVTLTVKVNENAKISGDGLSADWNDTTTVDNQATVVIGDNEYDTVIVTNPLEDDDPTNPEKSISSVQEPVYDGSGTITSYNAQTDTDENGNLYVSAGDRVTYRIKVYNNTSTTQTYYVVDTLDEGVDFISVGIGGKYYADGTTLTISGTGGEEVITVPAHSVVWTVTVYSFSTATLTVTVAVNETAHTARQTYSAVDPDDSESSYDFTYTDTASIANQASVYAINNSTAVYTNVVENPLDPEEPVEPEKTVVEVGGEAAGTPTVTTADDTVTYEYGSAKISDIIEYKITYYNNTTSSATITIVDTLDEDVSFVSATGVEKSSATAADTIVYELSTAADGRTIVTWTISDVNPLSGGDVELQVQVLETAVKKDANNEVITAESTVENQATVTVLSGDVENSATTNIVTNPVDDEPGDPEKTVADNSEAGEDGANVKAGDQITYEITYYNHSAEEAVVTITDKLDANVEFISASGVEKSEATAADTLVYELTTANDGRVTVTWSFTADSHEMGYVTLTVEVLDSAVQQGEVSNQATVQIGNEEAVDTNSVENPVDDDPEDPVKTETAIADADGEAKQTGTGTVGGIAVDETTEITADTTITYNEVAVGDQITYEISYYNHYGTPSDVTITDILDDGVDFVSASATYDKAVTDANGNVTVEETTIEGTLSDGTVTWKLTDVAAHYEGKVTLTVEVNRAAKTLTALEEANKTVAEVENSATVTVGTVTNRTNTVVNPLEDDEDETPVKTVDTDEDGVYEDDGESVAVGSKLVYQIAYTNHTNTYYGKQVIMVSKS